MKEDRLRKMREGKQRKKQLKDQQVEEALENAKNMTSIANIPQTLFNFNTPSTANNPVLATAPGQIVIKDGKPIFEFSESTRNPPVLVESRKPSKLSSLSFRKNNYTKHWTQEETRKFYKVTKFICHLLNELGNRNFWIRLFDDFKAIRK